MIINSDSILVEQVFELVKDCWSFLNTWVVHRVNAAPATRYNYVFICVDGKGMFSNYVIFLRALLVVKMTGNVLRP